MKQAWNRRAWLRTTGLATGIWTAQRAAAAPPGAASPAAPGTVRVALYGTNGHQVHRLVSKHPCAQLVAVAAFDPKTAPGVRRCATLDELISDKDIDLISLCSPRRADQAQDAIRCLRAGKHVYGEKPSALSERELDAIIAAARETGRQYHEMAGTIVQQPYMEMRRRIREGAIGTVVQVFAQKCYPWHDRRPSDEAVDGGLGTQAGVYVARFVEHIAGERIAAIELAETGLGNPVAASGCRMAVTISIRLANGGLASGICNYLNPMKERCWGYEILRVFGTKGVIESNADGAQARLIVEGCAPEPLALPGPTLDYCDLFLRSLAGGDPMPLALEDELSPTRWIVRARDKMRAGR